MAKIKPDWSAYDVHSNKYHKTWHFITYLNQYCRYIQTVFEVVLFYVVVRNWCHPARKMSSIFFILFTLRAVNDIAYAVFVEIDMRKWIDLRNGFLNDNDYFDAFTLEFDTILHIVICLNRFTAIVYPFAYNRIWNVRNNVFYVVLITGLSVVSCYVDVQFYREFDCLRAVLGLVCFVVLMLTLAIKFKSNSESAALIKKADKQLLYDTIFTSTFMVVTNVNYIFIDTNPYMSFKTFFVLASFDDFVYNSFFAVSIVFLFYISTAARDGLKLAIPLFSFWKPRNGQTRTAQNTTFTRVTAVETLSRALP